jgi:hypothetical protein
MKSRKISPRTHLIHEKQFVEGVLYLLKRVIGGGGKSWIGSHAWKSGNQTLVIRQGYDSLDYGNFGNFFGECYLFIPLPQGTIIQYGAPKITKQF